MVFFSAVISFSPLVFPLLSIFTFCSGCLLCKKLSQTQGLKVTLSYYLRASLAQESGRDSVGSSTLGLTGLQSWCLWGVTVSFQIQVPLLSSCDCWQSPFPVAVELMVTSFCKGGRRNSLCCFPHL